MSSGRLNGTELAVIALIPLAAFELVVDLPVATQAFGRVRLAAARVFELADAPSPVVEPVVRAPRAGRAVRPGGAPVWARYPGAATRRRCAG